MDWRPDAQLAIGLTPRGGLRQKQRNTATVPSRATENTTASITQPPFSPARLARGRPRGRGRGRGRGQGAGTVNAQSRTPAVQDSDVFSPAMTSLPPASSTAPSTFIRQPLSTPQTSLPPAQQPYTAPSMLPHPPYHSPAYLYTPYTHYPLYTLPPRYYPPASNPPKS